MSSSPCFAIGIIQVDRWNDEIEAYVREVGGTAQAHSGRFRAHGGRKHALEGAISGDLIIIEFPSLEAAQAWYASPAYQAILPLRLRHSHGTVLLLEGVPDGYRPEQLLAKLDADRPGS
jgi:uncharacterized protein (DUF1330 family)